MEEVRLERNPGSLFRLLARKVGRGSDCLCGTMRLSTREEGGSTTGGEKVAAANRQSTFVAISQDDGWKDRGTGSCCCRWPPGPITTPFFRTVEGRGRQRVELKRIALSSLSPFRGESPTLAYAHSLLCQKFVCRCGMPGRRTSCINRMRDAT